MTDTHRTSLHEFPFSTHLPNPPAPDKLSISCDPALHPGGDTLVTFWHGDRIQSIHRLHDSHPDSLADLLKGYWTLHAPHTLVISTAGTGADVIARMPKNIAPHSFTVVGEGHIHLAHVYQHSNPGRWADGQKAPAPEASPIDAQQTGVSGQTEGAPQEATYAQLRQLMHDAFRHEQRMAGIIGLTITSAVVWTSYTLIRLFS